MQIIKNGQPKSAVFQSAWLAALTATVVGELLPGNSKAMSWVGATHINDKTLHFTAYAVLAFIRVFGWHFTGRVDDLSGSRAGVCAAAGPFRSFEVADMMANALGVLSGTMLALVGQGWMARVET